MKKIVIVSFLLLFITGCQSQYNLTVNQDLSYQEQFEIVAPNTKFTNEQDLLKEIEDYIFYEPLEEKYNIALDVEGKQIKISGDKTDNDLTTLTESDYLLSFYEKVIIKDGLIHAKNYNNATLPSEDVPTDNTGLENIKFSFQLPFKILEHNALSLDENTNELTYEIKYNHFPEEIYIKYDPTRLYNQQYFKDIFDYISMDLLIGIGLVLLIMIAGLIIYKRNRQQSKQYHINY